MSDVNYPAALQINLEGMLRGLVEAVRVPAVEPVAKSFIANIDRTINMLILPTFCIYWARNFGRIEVEAMVNLTGVPRFSKASIDTEIIERLRREMDRLETEENRARMADPLPERPFPEAVACIPMVIAAGGTRAPSGFEAILANAIVGAWTTFETLAGDLWEVALNVHPYKLAELKGSPWMKAADNDESRGLTGDFRDTKSLRLSWLQRVEYDTRNSMGTLLRHKFDFASFDDVKNAYTVAWSAADDSAKIKVILGDQDLDLLQSIRNLLVHRGGVVDRKFLNRITKKSTKEINPHFTGAEIGKPLPINGTAVAHLVTVMIDSSKKLLTFVDAWLLDRASERQEA